MSKDPWAFFYHLFASAYGWTIKEIDEMTVPQMLALMDEMRGSPPTNMAIAQMRKADEARAQLSQDQALARMPNVSIAAPAASGHDGKTYRTKTGSILRRLEVRKTGKRII